MTTDETTAPADASQSSGPAADLTTFGGLLAAVTDPTGREILDPATGAVVGRTREGSPADIDAAVLAAAAAQPAWASRPVEERNDLLNKAADAIEASAEALAELGRPEAEEWYGRAASVGETGAPPVPPEEDGVFYDLEDFAPAEATVAPGQGEQNADGREPEVLTQRRPGVLGAEQPAPLQLGNDVIGEVVEAVAAGALRHVVVHRAVAVDRCLAEARPLGGDLFHRWVRDA